MKAVILLVCVLALVGCTTTLTPEQDSVRITTNSQATTGCKFIKALEEHAVNVWEPTDGQQRALAAMKITALKLGANLIFRTDQNLLGMTWYVKGEAYYCPTETTPPAK